VTKPVNRPDFDPFLESTVEKAHLLNSFGPIAGIPSENRRKKSQSGLLNLIFVANKW
jgi:hypothetical protein